MPNRFCERWASAATSCAPCSVPWADRPRDLAVFSPVAWPVQWSAGLAKGLADELYDRGYLVIDGIDGKAHYVALAELEQYPLGAVVEVSGSTDIRAADKTIAAHGRWPVSY